MRKSISRRSFLRSGVLAGTAILAGTRLGAAVGQTVTAARKASPPDLVVVSGSNYYDATVRAVELLGGMKRFVSRGSRVGLLVNSRYTKRGTFVKPEITLAIIAMCHQDGAAQIVSLENTSARYWRGATISRENQGYIEGIRSPRSHRTVAVSGGLNVKRVDVVPELLDCDVYINLPIFKNHEGIFFTGALKNLMGAISDTCNQTFHQGSDPDRNEYIYLSQSIADANLLRVPALSVGDATEVLIRGGPFGPGPVRNYRSVVASTDPVALDACGAEILGFRPEELEVLRCARRHGLGTPDLERLTIVRESL